MKKYVFLFIMLLAQVQGFTQVIRKMKAAELNTYIAQSKKPLVVSFWATWCGSCVEEIPYFISTIQEKYKDEVELVLVSLDIKSYYPKIIEAFVARKSFNVPIIWMDEPNADVFCPAIDPKWSGAIPSTLMVNNGKQYRKFYEVGMSPMQFDRNIKLLLEGKSLAVGTAVSR
jgi:thiol-disulfide isomerase/thioredoxin